jgi:hypothetical protein
MVYGLWFMVYGVVLSTGVHYTYTSTYSTIIAVLQYVQSTLQPTSDVQMCHSNFIKIILSPNP